MAGIIYTLCAMTAVLCAVLLLRGFRKSKHRLLLWGGICYVGLTFSNVLLVIDKLVVPLTDLSTFRYLVTLVAICILLFGLIWEGEA